jgi:3-oxoacyl-(acyl-carrier-protein) synthase
MYLVEQRSDGRLSIFPVELYAKQTSQVCGKVPWKGATAQPSDDIVLFDPDKYAGKSLQREMGRVGLYAVAAAGEALADADWVQKTEEDRYGTGTEVGRDAQSPLT